MAALAEVTIKGDAEIDALLARIPKLMVAKGGPTDKATRAAGTIVLRRARQLAPVSAKTGTEKKQSKKSRQAWQHEVRKNLAQKLIKYATTSVSIIGAKHPHGNAAHFMQEEPRRLVLWGKATRVAMYRVARNWIVKAADETRGEQTQKVRTVLTQEVDKVMRS